LDVSVTEKFKDKLIDSISLSSEALYLLAAPSTPYDWFKKYELEITKTGGMTFSSLEKSKEAKPLKKKTKPEVKIKLEETVETLPLEMERACDGLNITECSEPYTFKTAICSKLQGINQTGLTV
jgi:hypothetical protein